MVDAHEKRNIGTADIATAYLKAKMDNFILLMFTGKLVDIICNMYPEYKKFVTMEETARYCTSASAKQCTGASNLLCYGTTYSIREPISAI